MYDQIASNKRKTWFILVAFLVVIAFLGYALGIVWGDPYFGVAVATLIGMGFSLISYYKGDKVVLQLSGARPASKKEFPYLINTVEGLALAAGIPKPKIYVMDEQAINAFATGRDPAHAAVTVTTGALKKLNRTELEGVIAHEISHIKNYDIKVMMLTVMLVGIIVLISDLILRSMWFGNSNRKSDSRASAVLLVIGLVLAILAPLFAELMKLAVSRQREYLADASGALLTRYPPGLASALKKIEKDHAPQMRTASKATAHLFISNPFKKKSFAAFFSTHPPTADRIKRLEKM